MMDCREQVQAGHHRNSRSRHGGLGRSDVPDSSTNSRMLLSKLSRKNLAFAWSSYSPGATASIPRLLSDEARAHTKAELARAHAICVIVVTQRRIGFVE